MECIVINGMCYDLEKGALFAWYSSVKFKGMVSPVVRLERTALPVAKFFCSACRNVKIFKIAVYFVTARFPILGVYSRFFACIIYLYAYFGA